MTDLHVHDLRHTVGMRLREAGVPESTVADILWPSNPSMTRHYSMAQIAYFSPSWTPFQADRGRHFSVIVDGVSD